jgi:hypothetical protein
MAGKTTMPNALDLANAQWKDALSLTFPQTLAYSHAIVPEIAVPVDR